MAQNACQGQGHSLVFVAVDAEVMGALELAASMRPEAKPIIDWLKQRGLALYILSGDQEAPTRQLAAELGVTGYFASTLPEQKADRIKTLQAQGRQVCFIGDGINDAIALRRATVSISLRGATTLAIDAAQIVLMEDDLRQLRRLLELAQGYERAVTTNATLARRFSLAAATGVLLLPPFQFWTTELLWNIQFAIGLGIANRPLLGSPPGSEARCQPRVATRPAAAVAGCARHGPAFPGDAPLKTGSPYDSPVSASATAASRARAWRWMKKCPPGSYRRRKAPRVACRQASSCERCTSGSSRSPKATMGQSRGGRAARSCRSARSPAVPGPNLAKAEISAK
jgi:soluble P-type ATPase